MLIKHHIILMLKSEHLEIDSEGRSTTNYDIRDDFNFLIVNFPFKCINITAAPAYISLK